MSLQDSEARVGYMLTFNVRPQATTSKGSKKQYNDKFKTFIKKNEGKVIALQEVKHNIEVHTKRVGLLLETLEAEWSHVQSEDGGTCLLWNNNYWERTHSISGNQHDELVKEVQNSFTNTYHKSQISESKISDITRRFAAAVLQKRGTKNSAFFCSLHAPNSGKAEERATLIYHFMYNFRKISVRKGISVQIVGGDFNVPGATLERFVNLGTDAGNCPEDLSLEIHRSGNPTVFNENGVLTNELDYFCMNPRGSISVVKVQKKAFGSLTLLTHNPVEIEWKWSEDQQVHLQQQVQPKQTGWHGHPGHTLLPTEIGPPRILTFSLRCLIEGNTKNYKYYKLRIKPGKKYGNTIIKHEFATAGREQRSFLGEFFPEDVVNSMRGGDSQKIFLSPAFGTLTCSTSQVKGRPDTFDMTCYSISQNPNKINDKNVEKILEGSEDLLREYRAFRNDVLGPE